MHYQFKTAFGNDVQATVSGLSVLAKENWLNDFTICRVTEYFQYRYQDQDTQQPITIPFYHLQHWRSHLETPEYLSVGFPCDWQKGTFIDGQSNKIFAVVEMSNHWGAVCVDFKERRVHFGDSMKRTFPSDVRKAIARWLVHLGMDLTKWDSSVHLFHVPRQINSGSCGVVALNTIERTLNGKLSIWTNNHAACHRLRLMQLMTGYSTVCII
jgi:Ulp1 family protease